MQEQTRRCNNTIITKLLITNQGEIAYQVAAACRKLGIRTIAVYSDIDANTRHVAACDEAIHIGEPAVRGSYLCADRTLKAARATGAQAVHPNYGFLSKNETFAKAYASAGIILVGSLALTIEAMGSKSTAKTLTETAGVLLAPDHHGDNRDAAFLRAQTDRIGYPVLIKASAGDGGKDIRVIGPGDTFKASLASVKHEASSNFGDSHVLIEEYLACPRRAKIQVFADSFGDAVYLFEHDYSVQYHHQEALEEVPAPGMTLDRRRTMGEATVAAARTVSYVSAGMVESVVNEDDTSCFVEMNTRLQVRHPVTEVIMNEGLVEWRLRVASGEPLPRMQDELHTHDHALETYIHAENPNHGSLPPIGTLEMLHTPATVKFTVNTQASGEPAVVRVDTGVREGGATGLCYDPMVVKPIAQDRDHEEALARMLQASGNFHPMGLSSDIALLHRLVASELFTTANLDAGLIARSHDTLFPAVLDVPLDAIALTVATLLAREAHSLHTDMYDPHSPWAHDSDWRLSGMTERTLRFTHGDQPVNATLIYNRCGS